MMKKRSPPSPRASLLGAAGSREAGAGLVPAPASEMKTMRPAAL